MRFKGTIGSPKQLSQLVAMLGKLSDTCVVHMTPDTISFGVAASSNSGVHACAELSTHSLFLDYRIESRAENNRISFFVKIDNLSRALKSSSANANSKSLVKLTKKRGGAPTLTFEILLSDSAVQVQHDVPLRIVQDIEELHAYNEPVYGDSAPSLSVVLPQPDIRGLRNVLERMKGFSDYVLLTARDKPLDGAERTAMLQLQVERDNLVTISTCYTKLERVDVAGPAEAPTSPGGGDAATASQRQRQRQPLAVGGDGAEEVAEARVEIKKLYKCLQSVVVSDIKLHGGIVAILPDQALVLKVFLPSTVENHDSHVVFYCPVILS